MALNTRGGSKDPWLPFWRKSDIPCPLLTYRNAAFVHVILTPLTILCLIFTATMHTKTEIWWLKKTCSKYPDLPYC